MKNKILLSLFLIAGFFSANAQSTRIKLKQVEGGTQGQLPIVGSDGNLHIVASPFALSADSNVKYPSMYQFNLSNAKEVIGGSFNTSTGTLTLTKTNGQTVTFGLDGRYIPSSQKAAANGVASLGADGIVPASQLPAPRVSNVFVDASQSAMLGESTALRGDFSVRTDSNITYVLRQTPASVYGNWQVLPSAAGVTSVNGQTGPAVTITSDNVSEGAVNKYFSNTLARGAFSATSPLGYNGSTGVFSHAASGVTAGTYNNLTVDIYGHVVNASNVAYLTSANLSGYYTKTELQTSGSAAVHWGNITNKPTNLGAQEAKPEFTGGTSSVLTLPNTPIYPTAVLVFLNGQQLANADYAISGTTLTLGFSRETSDVITVKYSY